MPQWTAPALWQLDAESGPDCSLQGAYAIESATLPGWLQHKRIHFSQQSPARGLEVRRPCPQTLLEPPVIVTPTPLLLQKALDFLMVTAAPVSLSQSLPDVPSRRRGE